MYIHVAPTCTEDIMVLRANMVEHSLTVDWLSKAPWVSSNKMATWKDSQVESIKRNTRNTTVTVPAQAIGV
jgi:hypothetical protein